MARHQSGLFHSHFAGQRRRRRRFAKRSGSTAYLRAPTSVTLAQIDIFFKRPFQKTATGNSRRHFDLEMGSINGTIYPAFILGRRRDHHSSGPEFIQIQQIGSYFTHIFRAFPCGAITFEGIDTVATKKKFVRAPSNPRVVIYGVVSLSSLAYCDSARNFWKTKK